jgi:DNA mismatch endonuclease (patch repair protein)
VSGGIGYRPRASSRAASATMRANRPSSTMPEVRLRAALHHKGWRFRKNFVMRFGNVRTSPDIVFTRHRVAVFVDGCFWHSCPTHATTPKANSDYWVPKLRRNVARDRETTRALQDAGWSVVRIWEHTSVEEAVEIVERALGLHPAGRPIGHHPPAGQGESRRDSS